MKKVFHVNSYSYPGKKHFALRVLNGITITACNRKSDAISGAIIKDPIAVTCKQCKYVLDKEAKGEKN